MKKIKIAFCDCWDGFNKEDNFIINTLKKRYIVELIDEKDEKKTVEYLFFSCFGSENLYFDCVKIFFTGENIIPDFNLCDYAWGFEKLDFGDRYFRLPLYIMRNPSDYEMMMERHQFISHEQKKFCSFVVSQSTVADQSREKFFKMLSEYKQVDSGGRYLNNIGKPQGIEDKLEFQGEYKFCIAFENSSYPGYCTEKLMEAFASGGIPIYWGDPLVGKSFNTKAFINCHDYNSFEDVKRVVIELDNNMNKYMEVLKEKPIIDGNETREAYIRRFEKWLYSIIDQEYCTAKRISPYARMKIYRNEMVFKDQLDRRFGPIERTEIHTIWDRIVRKIRLIKR